MGGYFTPSWILSNIRVLTLYIFYVQGLFIKDGIKLLDAFDYTFFWGG